MEHELKHEATAFLVMVLLLEFAVACYASAMWGH
jgi:hypothetical protein